MSRTTGTPSDLLQLEADLREAGVGRWNGKVERAQQDVLDRDGPGRPRRVATRTSTRPQCRVLRTGCRRDCAPSMTGTALAALAAILGMQDDPRPRRRGRSRLRPQQHPWIKPAAHAWIPAIRDAHDHRCDRSGRPAGGRRSCPTGSGRLPCDHAADASPRSPAARSPSRTRRLGGPRRSRRALGNPNSSRSSTRAGRGRGPLGGPSDQGLRRRPGPRRPSRDRAASRGTSRRTPRRPGWCPAADASAGRRGRGIAGGSPFDVAESDLGPRGPSVTATIGTIPGDRFAVVERLPLRPVAAEDVDAIGEASDGIVAIGHVPHAPGRRTASGRPGPQDGSRPAGSAARRRRAGRRAPALRNPDRIEGRVAAAETDRQLVAELAAGDEQGPVGWRDRATRIGRCSDTVRASSRSISPAGRIDPRPEGRVERAAQRRGVAGAHPAQVVVPVESPRPARWPVSPSADRIAEADLAPRTGPAGRHADLEHGAARAIDRDRPAVAELPLALDALIDGRSLIVGAAAGRRARPGRDRPDRRPRRGDRAMVELAQVPSAVSPDPVPPRRGVDYTRDIVRTSAVVRDCGLRRDRRRPTSPKQRGDRVVGCRTMRIVGGIARPSGGQRPGPDAHAQEPDDRGLLAGGRPDVLASPRAEARVRPRAPSRGRSWPRPPGSSSTPTSTTSRRCRCYVARRRMMKMEPPTIYLPAEAVEAVEALLRAFQRLDRGRMPAEAGRPQARRGGRALARAGRQGVRHPAHDPLARVTSSGSAGRSSSPSIST